MNTMQRTVKYLIFIVSFVCIFNLAYGESDEHKRKKEVGVILINENLISRYTEKEQATAVELMQKQGMDPELISAEVFLTSNKGIRNQFKRIVILLRSFYFTPEMYEGMTDYVASGGLLISNSSLIGIDVNSDGKFDVKAGDGYFTKKKTFSLIGIHGRSSISAREMTILVDCPLTRGFQLKEPINFKHPISVREVRNINASVIATASVFKGEKMLSDHMPFVTFNHREHGACIYIAPPFHTEQGGKFLLNALSNDTLEWLTAGNEKVE